MTGTHAEPDTPKQTAMSHQLSQHHPAVVLRSHNLQLRALLAVAMIAVIGLSAAVAILTTSDTATPAPAPPHR